MGHEDDYGVPLDEDMEEEEVSVPSSAELYPNPCGGWADVGPFRDVWWVLVWVLSLGLLGFFGVHNYTSGNYYISSSGTVDLIFNPGTNAVQYTANADGECSHLPQTTHSIAVRCDDEFLYIGGMQHTYEDEAMINIKNHKKNSKAATFYSECTQEDGAPGRLKRDPLTKAIPLSQLADQGDSDYFQLPKGLPYSTVKVAANRCTVDDSTTSGRTMRLLGLACFLSIVVGVAQLFLMRAFPRETIIGGFIVMAVVCAGLAAFAGANSDILGAIVFGLCAVIWPIFLCLMWSHLALAALCLKMSSNVVLTYWGTMVTSTGVLLLQFVLVFTFVFAAGNDNGEANAVSVICLFILFWGQEVLLNTVHVTTAGVTSHWFFALGGPGTPPYFQGAQAATTGVTLGALKRAAVWSLGSICFGSLFVAILRTIRFLIRVAMRRGNALVRCIVLCLLNYIEQLMRYFNDFAFVQVAMFGKPYITAARDTWALVKNGTGWEALVNQVMVNRIFVAFSLQGGLIVGLVTYLASGRQMVWFLAGGLTGLLLVSMLMKLAYSGVMTVFLGFWHLKSCGVTWSPVELNGYKVEPEVSDAMATQYATVGTVDEDEGRVN